MARNDEAMKYEGISKLYFYDKRLYAGCYGRICIWDLDIKSQVFKYRGDFGVNPKFGEVIGFDAVNNFIFFAQYGGSYEVVDVNKNYTSMDDVGGIIIAVATLAKAYQLFVKPFYGNFRIWVITIVDNNLIGKLCKLSK